MGPASLAPAPGRCHWLVPGLAVLFRPLMLQVSAGLCSGGLSAPTARFSPVAMLWPPLPWLARYLRIRRHHQPAHCGGCTPRITGAARGCWGGHGPHWHPPKSSVTGGGGGPGKMQTVDGRRRSVCTAIGSGDNHRHACWTVPLTVACRSVAADMADCGRLGIDAAGGWWSGLSIAQGKKFAGARSCG